MFRPPRLATATCLLAALLVRTPSAGSQDRPDGDGGAGAPASPAAPGSPAPAPRPIGRAEILLEGAAEEVLGPQDLLEISVFDLEQLDRTVRVADDGSVTLPFVGRIQVSGMSRVALEQRIAELLGDKYIQDPQVSVFVKEYNSRKISVSGAVKNPATFELLGTKTLLDVISEAGGFTEDVGRTVYVVRRRPGGETERVGIDLERLVHRGEMSLNIPVHPGDVIYAPITEKVTIYVNGAVKDPGSYEFKYDEIITVLRAITKAGGTTDRAAERKVQIVRLLPDGSQTYIPVDLRKVRSGKSPDPILQREDVIDVPEAFF